jgi:hypothetical protein
MHSILFQLVRMKWYLRRIRVKDSYPFLLELDLQGSNIDSEWNEDVEPKILEDCQQIYDKLLSCQDPSFPSTCLLPRTSYVYDATGIITAAGAAYRAGKTVVIGIIAKYLFYLGHSIDLSVAGHIFYGLECGENKK